MTKALLLSHSSLSKTGFCSISCDRTTGASWYGHHWQWFAPDWAAIPRQGYLTCCLSWERIAIGLDRPFCGWNHRDQMLGGGSSISGDFSINVDLGFLVQNGQVVGRVKDTMVAGNVYTALKHVVALAAMPNGTDLATLRL